MEAFKNKNITNSHIMQAIVETIAFFDLFDFPLTDFEVRQYIDVKCELNDVQTVLNNKELHDFIEEKNGFYFLAGRREIIKTRQERRGYAQRKIKKAARVSKLFKLIPWIKMIAVGNIIGTDNLKDESDIDLFIITEPERIWLARFFCAGLAQLLGLRPKKNNTRDKICLSFFVSEEAMNLEKLMLDGGKPSPSPRALERGRDVYFIYWLAGLKPVYNKAGIYEKFMEANGWIKEYLPNWQGPFCHSRGLQHSRKRVGNPGVNRKNLFVPLTPGFPVKLGMTVIKQLEQKAKKLQLELLPADLKKIMNKDTRVVINDKILKLHSNDRREEYRRKWVSKIQGII
ncbi:MAG: hypothetical protein Q8N21_04470 [bacterium]|nr:hypothetical protein [bacterium]